MSNTATFTVNLPSDFINLLDEEIDNELTVAQGKWKLKLTDEQLELVRKSARDQLRSKVSGLAKNTWDLGSKLVINASGETGSYTVKEDSVKPAKEISLLLNKNGWSVTNEEADAVVPLDKFYESLLSTIFTWTRTAVFYGVGSYTR